MVAARFARRMKQLSVNKPRCVFSLYNFFQKTELKKGAPMIIGTPLLFYKEYKIINKVFGETGSILQEVFMPGIKGAIPRSWLADVPDNKRFWCCDGKVITNLAELEAALRRMNIGTFQYHCNKSKCDFGNWVRDVIGDEKLAGDLMQSSDPVRAAAYITTRIKWLERKE
jgi:hypothetical protein